MVNQPCIISAVDHVIEPPDIWTRRLAKNKFADRIPHLERAADGSDLWTVDGRKFPLGTIARVGALMNDRVRIPTRWEEIPKAAYDPAARLTAMDEDGVDCTILYPSLGGFSGEIFARIG